VTPLSPVPTSDRGSLRAALVAGVAVAALLSLSQSADARRLRLYGYGWNAGYGEYSVRRIRGGSHGVSHARRERSEPKKEVGFGEMPKGPLQIVVNIGTQRVTLYSNGVRVAQGPVSTGVPGHPTPLGVFSVIEKDRYHHSNIYSGAPMPFMQRITWSGVALHEGVLPGHPASHGCIRMSHDFAQKLWPITKLGVRVLVVRNEVVPHDFEHANLLVPKSKPGEPPTAMIGPTDGQGGSLPMAFAQAGERGLADAVPERLSEANEEARPVEGEDRLVQTTRPGEEMKERKGEADVIESGKSSGEIKSGEAIKVTLPEESEVAKPSAAEKVEEAKPAEPGTRPSGPELRRAVELPLEPAGTAEITSSTIPPAPEQASAAEESVKPAPTDDPPKPTTPRSKSADQPPKRAGQIAVFVSRKEKKIFVRQGFAPVFEMPITIDEPDRPLGTHVFTAMGPQQNGSGMRWNLMTIATDGSTIEPREGRRRSKEPPKVMPSLKPPSGPAEALNRIHFPKEAMDRISELLIPSSSLVISDEGLGRETGRATEFIVLTR
jgi:hypothetical protein